MGEFDTFEGEVCKVDLSLNNMINSDDRLLEIHYISIFFSFLQSFSKNINCTIIDSLNLRQLIFLFLQLNVISWQLWYNWKFNNWSPVDSRQGPADTEIPTFVMLGGYVTLSALICYVACFAYLWAKY